MTKAEISKLLEAVKNAPIENKSEIHVSVNGTEYSFQNRDFPFVDNEAWRQNLLKLIEKRCKHKFVTALKADDINKTCIQRQNQLLREQLWKRDKEIFLMNGPGVCYWYFRDTNDVYVLCSDKRTATEKSVECGRKKSDIFKLYVTSDQWILLLHAAKSQRTKQKAQRNKISYITSTPGTII